MMDRIEPEIWLTEKRAEVRALGNRLPPPQCTRCDALMTEHWDFPGQCEGFHMPIHRQPFAPNYAALGLGSAAECEGRN